MMRLYEVRCGPCRRSVGFESDRFPVSAVCPGCGRTVPVQEVKDAAELLDQLVAEEAANNIGLAQNNKGTCPMWTCRERVGETKEGRWFHLTGPDAGGRACFDLDDARRRAA